MFKYSKPETKTGKKTLTKRKLAELNAKPLDEMDDRRLRAENLKSSFSGQYAPSFHHFYDAAELDHGNNDRRAKTSVYKKVETIIDDSEPYVPDEEDIKDAQCLAVAETLASLTPGERKPPRAPRSNVKYCEEYRARLSSIKVVLISHGGRHVPYTSPKLLSAIEKR